VQSRRSASSDGNALPNTFAGLGVREYLLVLFLGVTARVESERALAASFVAFSITLIICLLGAMLYIFYRPQSKAEASEPSVESAVPGR